jgi:hypothetical protein
MSLQLKNFKKLIFVNKKWYNDLIVGCKTPFNLVAIIEMNVDFKKNELEEFETEFTREEIVDMWKFGKNLDFPCQKFCGWNPSRFSEVVYKNSKKELARFFKSRLMTRTSISHEEERTTKHKYRPHWTHST